MVLHFYNVIISKARQFLFWEIQFNLLTCSKWDYSWHLLFRSPSTWYDKGSPLMNYGYSTPPRQCQHWNRTVHTIRYRRNADWLDRTLKRVHVCLWSLLWFVWQWPEFTIYREPMQLLMDKGRFCFSPEKKDILNLYRTNEISLV